MDDNEKILNEKFEFEGIFADVIEALDRSRDIVCTASKITKSHTFILLNTDFSLCMSSHPTPKCPQGPG